MAARALKVKAVICVPGQCPGKAESYLKSGEYVELRVIGTYYDEAEAESMKMLKEKTWYLSSRLTILISAGQGLSDWKCSSMNLSLT